VNVEDSADEADLVAAWGIVAATWACCASEEVREERSHRRTEHKRSAKPSKKHGTTLQPPDIDREALRDASEEERQAAFAKMQEFGESLEKEVRTKVAGILDEAQMKRLRGLWVQRAGALAALTSEEIATELKLNDDQKSQLKTQRDEQRAQMRGGALVAVARVARGTLRRQANPAARSRRRQLPGTVPRSPPRC
jgi:hypothetical protein